MGKVQVVEVGIWRRLGRVRDTASRSFDRAASACSAPALVTCPDALAHDASRDDNVVR